MRYFFILFFLLWVGNSFSQQKKIYTTTRTSQAPKIDGILNDACWKETNWSGDFTQREPIDGAKPSQRTEFKLVYDDTYIYVAVKLFDDEPNKIDSRMTRRDNMKGDLVAVHFDSYYDKRTSFSFFVSAGGVKTDIIFSNGGSKQDVNWNPIWWTKTSKDSLGWYAEMKIPLSQLRFSKNDNKIWGFEVARFINRSQELSLWEPISPSESGWVYHFGELHGISELKPKRILEIAPFVSGGFETFEKEEGNPFLTGSKWLYRVGVDGKVGITNDFVLDFAINPDFGQVEADPSEVNLTAFETYFEERRPFFIEGGNILDFKIQSGDDESTRDNLFYSRRIGRSPQYYPDVNDTDYIDLPMVTDIIGALKITGKTKKGLSIGVLESVTREEKAQIASGENRRTESVEPLTNYFVGRIQKDFDKGNTQIGGEFTSTNRKLNPSLSAYLPKDAVSGGLDFNHYWGHQKYYITLKTIASYAGGDSAAITELQFAPQRYYQRPDANHINLDYSRTSLSGYGGDFSIGKNIESGLAYSFNVSVRSPGISLNDIGYLRVSDRIAQHFMIYYKWTEPKSFYRNINLGFIQWNGWDFGGNSTYNGGAGWSNIVFKNLYTLSIHGSAEYGIHDNHMLRGGPAFSSPGNVHFRINLESNNSKKFYLDFGSSQGFGQYNASRYNSWDAGFTYRPINALELQFHPNFSTNSHDLQYVEETTYNGNPRYILASINQSSLYFRFKVNFNITPNLTIQYFGAPFISTGEYSRFKKVMEANASNYSDRFYEFNNQEINYEVESDTYFVDENGDGNSDYSIGNPNFDFKQFQSNLVIRWEYTAGSVLYLVWNQNITNEDGFGVFHFNTDFNDLFSTTPFNVFLIKFSYRFMK